MIAYCNLTFKRSHFCFLHKGRFTMAAKHHITVAEIHENNAADLEKVTLN